MKITTTISIHCTLLMTLGARSMVGARGRNRKRSNAVGVPWGPQNCAEIFRSATTGTCVIRTSCEAVDISNFEFAFDCESSGEVQRHSFGKGGFDDDDEFDTSVKCTACVPPEHTEEHMIKPHHIHHEISVEKLSTPAAANKNPKHQEVAVERLPEVTPSNSWRAHAPSHKVVPRIHAHQEVVVAGVKLSATSRAEMETEAKAKSSHTRMDMSVREGVALRKGTPPSNAVKYGPGNCVSTWRDNKTGHCIMQTDCEGQDIVNHNFGLGCKGKTSLVRHMFGENSFATKETFDTLIDCEECQSLDSDVRDSKEDKTLPDLVKDLAGAVGSIKDGVHNLNLRVAELNKAVFPPKASQANESQTAVGLTDTGIDEHVTVNHQKSAQLRGQKSQPAKQQKQYPNATSQVSKHNEIQHADDDEDDSSEGDDATEADAGS
jgi:hypothetical protein